MQAGYTPLMLAAACGVEISNQREVVAHLIGRGNVNAVVHQVSYKCFACVHMCHTGALHECLSLQMYLSGTHLRAMQY